MTENPDNNNIPWVEKYRPHKLDDMVQEDSILNLLRNSVKTGEMNHFLFYGNSGTGKTSAALALGRELFKEYFSSRVFEFNASDDRGINAVREKISNEARKYVGETFSKDGTRIPPYKIIILDEGDAMTSEAQDALRVIIEQYSTVTRFCFICNYISMITEAIKSRCSAVYFKKLSNECMISKLNEIAIKEGMELSQEIFNHTINVSNGDMRKAIGVLQQTKYLYNFKNSMNKRLSDMTIVELKSIPAINGTKITTDKITVDDIYEIAATISMDKAHEIIKDTLLCKSIIEVTALSKKIIAMGYPIDNVLSQINKAVIETKKLDDKQKAQIIQYSGKIFLKMKEYANEYIQISDFLACIYGIKNGITAYELC